MYCENYSCDNLHFLGLCHPVGVLHLLFVSIQTSYVSRVYWLHLRVAIPDGTVVKNPPAVTGDAVLTQVGKIPWSKKCQPTPVFLPGKFHEYFEVITKWPCFLKKYLIFGCAGYSLPHAGFLQWCQAGATL